MKFLTVKPSPLPILEVQYRINKSSNIIPILRRIKLLPRINPISLTFFVILPSHLRLGIFKGLYPVGLPIKIWKALLPSCIMPT